MWIGFNIILFITVHCTIISASTVVLESNPKVVYPYLSKKLVLRCSVKRDSWSPNENLSKSQGLTSSEKGDFQHLMSIVVTEGKRETIASVTGCDPPVIEPPFLRLVQAEGDAEKSPATDEMGYLTLTWDRPLVKDADNFTCEAYALNANKSSVSLNVTLEVTAVEPEMSDLMNYIAINDRKIEALERTLAEAIRELSAEYHIINKTVSTKTSSLLHQVSRIPIINMQTGSYRCERRDIVFRKPFNFPPKVFTSFEGKQWHQPHHTPEIRINILDVNATGFSVECEYSSNKREVHWLAVE